jgi:hypothetical protein
MRSQRRSDAQLNPKCDGCWWGAGILVRQTQMVLLESAIAAGLGYTAYSLWTVSRSYEAEEGVLCNEKGATGVEFRKEKVTHDFPILINTGHVILPIFGGSDRTEEQLTSWWRLEGCADQKPMVGLSTRHDENPVITVADTEAALGALLQANGIPQRPFSATTPIIAYSYMIRSPIWYDVKASVISTNRKWVATHAAWARRPFGAVTVAAGLAVVGATQMIEHSVRSGSEYVKCDCVWCRHRKI